MLNSVSEKNKQKSARKLHGVDKKVTKTFNTINHDWVQIDIINKANRMEKKSMFPIE